MRRVTRPAASRPKFHRLAIAQVRELTEDSIEVTFDIPEQLRDEFRYRGGQYVTVRAEVDGEVVQRSYSICSSPASNVLSIAIKQDQNGTFSSWALSNLRAGMTMSVLKPLGEFVSAHGQRRESDAGQTPSDIVRDEIRDHATPYIVAIAAGSGITPIMSITQELLTASDVATVDLVYSNRTPSSVMFARELDELQREYPGRFRVHHIYSRSAVQTPLRAGRLDAPKLHELLDAAAAAFPNADVDEWLLCGPNGLVETAKAVLQERGVAPERIKHEMFATSAKPQKPQEPATS